MGSPTSFDGASLKKDGGAEDQVLSNPQTCQKSLSNWSWEAGYHQQMKSLLETGLMSDTTLILGSNKDEVKVHKLILQKGSPVFYEKFQISGVKELTVEDADPEIFKLLLNALYTGESGVEIGNALPLLKLATDYKMTELADQCAQVLSQQVLTNENVVNLHEQAVEYGRKELIDSTGAYICKNAWSIIKLDQFLEMKEVCLLEVLGRDDLLVKNEIELFEALFEWGKAECKRKSWDSSDAKNMRNALDQLIGHVRFPLMNGEEFTLKVALTNILTQEELISILLYFQVSSEKRSLIPAGRFKSSARVAFVKYNAQNQQICNNCDFAKNPSYTRAHGYNRQTHANLPYCFC